MTKPALYVRRLTLPDEDGLIRVEVRARNETVAANGEGYTSPPHLMQFAETLVTFPKQIPDSASFTLASGDCTIAIILETVGNLGSVAMDVRLEVHPDVAVLRIHSEPGLLMHFGQQLRSVAALSAEEAQLPQ
jgi:hypothetical protein